MIFVRTNQQLARLYTRRNHITWFATTKHDEQETVLSNLPDPGKVEFVVDGHAASGNPTDPLLAAAGRTMVPKMLFCFRHHNSGRKKGVRNRFLLQMQSETEPVRELPHLVPTH